MNLVLIVRDCPTETARWKMERRWKNKAMRKTWECLMILGDVDSIVSLWTLGINGIDSHRIPLDSFVIALLKLHVAT